MKDIAFNLYVCDENLNVISEIYAIESLQWLEEYNGEGEVKLVCANTQMNAELLNVGNRLWLKDRPHLHAVIDTIETYEDSEKSTITARGVFSVGMWENRIVPHIYELENANVENSIINLLNVNKRLLPCEIASAQGFEQIVSGSFKWKSVLEIVKELTKEADVGFKHIIDEVGSEAFTLYTGVDRTDPHGENYIGFFSVAAGNIENLNTEKSEVDYKNKAYVCGAGDETERIIEIVDLSDGQNVKEIYVNADDISDSNRTENADGTSTTITYTEQEQRELLRARGYQELVKNKKTYTVSAEVLQKNIFFGKDYELGDIMPLVLYTGQKITCNARITAVKLIYEEYKQIDTILEVSL